MGAFLSSTTPWSNSFSALQRAEIAEITRAPSLGSTQASFSALQRAEIAEIEAQSFYRPHLTVSVLFNEPKLLKSRVGKVTDKISQSFSALQRAEIAEIACWLSLHATSKRRFSALQRAEIAEMKTQHVSSDTYSRVSVLFNEPKLLKSPRRGDDPARDREFQCSSTSRNC